MYEEITVDEYLRDKKICEIAIVTTDRCQARCAHCLMESSPDRTEQLSARQITDYIDYFSAKEELQLVCFTGGESTLLGDDLLEAIAYCSENDIPTRLVTNAIWADNEVSAQKTVSALCEVGLTEINISTDDFHAVWISLENVKTAWKACKGKGFKTVLIATCSGPRSKVTPASVRDFIGEPEVKIYKDIELQGDLPHASDGTFYGISDNNITSLGRATHLRKDYFRKVNSTTVGAEVYGACPAQYRPLTITADGSIGICCGVNCEYNKVLSLGPLKDSAGNPKVVGRFQQLMIDAISILGPAALYSLASENSSAIEAFSPQTCCEVCSRLLASKKLMTKLEEKADIIEERVKLARTPFLVRG